MMKQSRSHPWIIGRWSSILILTIASIAAGLTQPREMNTRGTTSAQPPLPPSGTFTKLKMERAQGWLRILPAVTQLQVDGLDEATFQAVFARLKHMRTGGDDDYTPARFRDACAPEGRQQCGALVTLYINLYWDLEGVVAKDHIWREVFKEFVMRKEYPGL